MLYHAIPHATTMPSNRLTHDQRAEYLTLYVRRVPKEKHELPAEGQLEVVRPSGRVLTLVDGGPLGTIQLSRHSQLLKPQWHDDGSGPFGYILLGGYWL